MKKLFSFLLATLCLSTQVYAEKVTASQTLPQNGKPEHVYKVVSGNNVYLGPETAPATDEIGLFAFYAVDGQSNAFDEKYNDEAVDLGSGSGKESKSESVYSGPSVLSYTLEGRKASKLPIPAYRCYGCGDVTVIITVDPQGNVVAAKVLDEISSSDSCLRSFAVRAARLSKFSASSSAPARQNGEILYRFIAQ